MKLFEKEVWRQTLAALISLLSFILLYNGGVDNNQILIYLGLIIFGVSVLGPVVIKILKTKGDSYE